MDTFLKELLASLVGIVSAFILSSKIRLYFEIRKSLKINILGLVQGASYIYRYILAPCTNIYFSVYFSLSYQNSLVPIVLIAPNEELKFHRTLIHNILLWVVEKPSKFDPVG